MIHDNTCVQRKLISGKIVSKTQVAPGHFQMGLLCPYVAQNAMPGQFIQVRVSRTYDPLLCRPFAVYRTRGGVFDILFKVVGKGTRILAEKAVGDTLDITGPLGNCFPVDSDFQRAILVAGGMGIASLMTLIEAIGSHRVTVLLGASTRDRLIGVNDLKASGVEIQVATEDGSAGYRGLVSELLERTLSEDSGRKTQDARRIFSCGPIPMLEAVSRIAARHNIPAYISLEERMACGIGACLGCACQVVSSEGETVYKMVCTDGPIFDAREIVLSEVPKVSV